MQAQISIHALREESDGNQLLRHDCRIYFNPRPPRGERHPQAFSQGMATIFQSTPSARRATIRNDEPKAGTRYFNPRPPRGERLADSAPDALPARFQSTPSARRATVASFCRCLLPVDFNPRPPRGGRPITFSVLTASCGFQSTPSARRATENVPGVNHETGISIHALREESDSSQCPHQSWPHDFNPRPPRGERLFDNTFFRGHFYFNPRPPRGERLVCCKVVCDVMRISIHALREESDLSVFCFPYIDVYISIHALREESDEDTGYFESIEPISIHALREESDQLQKRLVPRQLNFNPRPPRGERQPAPCGLSEPF